MAGSSRAMVNVWAWPPLEHRKQLLRMARVRFVAQMAHALARVKALRLRVETMSAQSEPPRHASLGVIEKLPTDTLGAQRFGHEKLVEALFRKGECHHSHDALVLHSDA